jgi:hypothetical protein
LEDYLAWHTVCVLRSAETLPLFKNNFAMESLHMPTICFLLAVSLFTDHNSLPLPHNATSNDSFHVSDRSSHSATIQSKKATLGGAVDTLLINETNHHPELQLHLNSNLQRELQLSLQREAILRSELQKLQLLQSSDNKPLSEKNNEPLQAPARHGLRAGLKLGFTLPCGARSELHLHATPSRWCVHEHHARGLIKRKPTLKSSPSSDAQLLATLEDGKTLVYIDCHNLLQIVVRP